MTKSYSEFPYPRFRLRRYFCKVVARTLAYGLARVQVSGLENIPHDEPIIFVANHFSFADPVLSIAFLPWHHEYLAGTVSPTAPNKMIANVQNVWGVYKVNRAGNSRFAFHAAEAVLAQKGMLYIYPEGGSWANVLVPPRPGAALIASNNNCRLVPVAVQTEGLFEIFRSGRRGQITFAVGEPFTPLEVTGRGRVRRAQLEAVGEQMMRKISELLPPEKRGVYSDDPLLLAEAEKVAAYPWETKEQG